MGSEFLDQDERVYSRSVIGRWSPLRARTRRLRLLENSCRPRGAATNQVGSAGHLQRLHVVAHRRVEHTRTVVLKFQRHREIGEVHVRRRTATGVIVRLPIFVSQNSSSFVS